MSTDVKKILVVEDDEDLLELTLDMLAEPCFELLSATSGNKALKLAKENNFDLILTDIRMSDGDGIFLLNEIRKINQQHPLVVMITGYTEYSTESLLNLGANLVVYKPISYEEIKKALHRLLMG